MNPLIVIYSLQAQYCDGERNGWKQREGERERAVRGWAYPRPAEHQAKKETQLY